MRRVVSLQANVLANYAGQIYLAVVNVVLLPLQVDLLGSEAYGLVGFFAMLSGWLQLLDVGLSPTLARETAKFRAGALEASVFAPLVRSAELVFISIGASVALVVAMLSGVISRHWLHPQALSTASVATALSLMGVVFAFRWQATLWRSVLVGLERQVWVNFLNAVFATMRSAGVLVVLTFVEPSPGAFFLYQAIVAVLELIVVRISVTRSLVLPTVGFRERWSFAPLKRVAGFSTTIAFAATVWVISTQLDNLLLSKFLPLAEYAWFTLAVTAAAGINLLSAPIGQAVHPRLTFFFSSAEQAAFERTYSEATQMLSAIALTASFVVAGGARALLWAWTGNANLADRAAPVLAFYALGNGFSAVVTMAYYLQVARGDLRLHLKGNLVFAVVLTPAIVFATMRAGMLGAAVAWFASNVAFFLVWSAIVHRSFLPGRHLRWLAVDTLLPAVAGLLPSLLLRLVHWRDLGRGATLAVLLGVGALSASLACLTTRPARRVLSMLSLRKELQ